MNAAGHKYVLVITDAFSKLAELVPLKDKEEGTVARAIVDTWICHYSTPKVPKTDWGREFCVLYLYCWTSCSTGWGSIGGVR